MQTEQELLEQFKKESINLYRLNNFIDTINKIELEGIDQLVRFSHDNNINNMFYFYYYLKEESLIIDEKITRNLDIDAELLVVLQEEFNQYNNIISELDFNTPVGLDIYCLYNGMVIEVAENICVVGIDIQTPEDACMMIVLKYEEEINQHKKERLDNIEEKRKELSDKILNDKEFHRCTNISLRKSYGDRVIRNNPEYKQLFLNRGCWYDIPINDFIEILWREYKEISKPPIITEFPYKN